MSTKVRSLWDGGNDALLGVVTRANVVCGFHGGDPACGAVGARFCRS
ncbi:MAG: LamB/YcsF family protein [Actinomycetota bacterium]|nr:LamB/YcsF family protein [Actinomycetota bacterium]